MATQIPNLFRPMTATAWLLVGGLCLATIGVTQHASAEVAAIHLNDGTTVRGEVIGLKGGSYQIRTESLGELSIPQEKIKIVGNACEHFITTTKFSKPNGRHSIANQ